MGTIILPATLDYRIRHPWIRFHADRPQAIDMQATPLFTTCNPQPADDAVVYDVLQLLDSGRRAGAYSFLTCECGVPDDVGILGKTCVTHDDTRILWTMAIVDFKPIIAAAWHGQAETLQLVFDKEPYRRTVHNILAALQRRLRDGVRLDDSAKKISPAATTAHQNCVMCAASFRIAKRCRLIPSTLTMPMAKRGYSPLIFPACGTSGARVKNR